MTRFALKVKYSSKEKYQAFESLIEQTDLASKRGTIVFCGQNRIDEIIKRGDKKEKAKEKGKGKAKPCKKKEKHNGAKDAASLLPAWSPTAVLQRLDPA